MPATATNKDTPAYQHGMYAVMEPRWWTCRNVYGGTETMRENYNDYLWQAVAETDDEFKARAAQLEVFPAFKQTVDGLTGVAFRVEPKLGADVPADIVADCENIDGQGNHITVFLKELFRDALRDGHQGILVDAPVTRDKEGKPLFVTAGQEQRAGVRPIWIQIYPDNILSWRVGIKDGRVILTQLVVKETTEEPAGFFASEEAVWYRKYRIEDDGTVSYRVWDEDMVNNWTADSYAKPLEAGTITNQTEIPFAVVYGGPRLAPLVSVPPLIDLAHANISHTNVVSDRRNGIHAAMHPILVTKGRIKSRKNLVESAAKKEDDTIDLGPGVGIDLPASPDANAFIIEHKGTALGEGRNEIKDIEMRMASMGLAMLQNDTRAAETAEAKRIEKDEKTANLSSAVRSMQDAAELCLIYHANFKRLPQGGSLVVNRQFEVKPLEPAMVTALSNMVGNGQLSLETLWKIMERQELLPEEFTSEEELLRIVKSGMEPGVGKPEPAPTEPNPAPEEAVA